MTTAPASPTLSPMAKTGLGRGLSSLLGARSPADKKTKSGKKPASTPPPAIAETPNEGPVGEILPGAMQPRNGMDDDTLNELAESIRENGIMQPLVVRPREGGYELIAGERRWRAAQMAGLATGVGTIMAASDIRLKENVKQIGQSPSGINIYSFNFKEDDDQYQGVLAHEVPYAAIVDDNGYWKVDYSQLDVEFKRIN